MNSRYNIKFIVILTALSVLCSPGTGGQNQVYSNKPNMTDREDSVQVKKALDSLEQMIFCGVGPEASIDPSTWTNYLNEQLQHLADSMSDCLEAGEYKVVVKFQVNENGCVSGSEPVSFDNLALAKLAARVIDKSPKWKPSLSSDRPVRSFRIQPLTFIILKTENKIDSCDVPSQNLFTGI